MIHLLKDLSCIDARDKLIIKFKGKSLATVSKSTLEQLCKEALGQDIVISNTDKKALQLGSDYNKLRKQYYKNKVRNINFNTSHRDFKHLLGALEIIEKLETTNLKFLKSQIKGLEFVNGNQGIFPKVSQLSTTGAEERIISYLEDIGEFRHSTFEDSDLTIVNGEVTINENDRKTALKHNKKYMHLLRKLKKNEASLNEARYLKLCRKARKGSVGPIISEYIKKLKE